MTNSKLYHANATYMCGSTDKIIRVYIGCSNDRKRALELCNNYKNKTKNVIKTWIESVEETKKQAVQDWQSQHTA